MEKRTTIYDIARELGISTATVNRALNGKPRVKEETRAQVLETAEKLGFKPNLLARSLARRKLRIAVVAFTSFPEFHSRFIEGTREAGRELRDFNVEVDYFSYNDGASDTPDAERFLNDTLEHIVSSGYDGALVLARQHEVLRRFAERGVYLAAAVNDVEPDLRRFYVSYNGLIAGRIAAELIYRLMPDRTKPIAVASAWAGIGIHKLIDQGFHEQLEIMPLNLFRICYNIDNADVAYASTCQLLDDCPDLGAIYVNSFNSSGVLRAVRERGLAGKILMITSDISEELRACIRDGVVTATIFQNQYEQGKRGLHMLYQALANNEPVHGNIMIDPQIVMRSNLDLFI